MSRGLRISDSSLPLNHEKRTLRECQGWDDALEAIAEFRQMGYESSRLRVDQMWFHAPIEPVDTRKLQIVVRELMNERAREIRRNVQRREPRVVPARLSMTSS